ncbi:FHIPEP family type III secretion protein [Paenarthrobacter sp. C1]|uniref:FHIPEP family type III secretion protein n=1 Tax=Paenarthrobacter sp. C1 TaxID=3400220 RepID=UPI003BF47A7A
MSTTAPAPAGTGKLPGRTGASSQRMARIGVPLAIVGVVVLLVVPLPTALLDLLLAANLVGAVLILLTALTVKKPLDFSIFPALLLIATLARLALNVSTTRLILLHGDAGHVVEAFGNFVIGGNMIVGFVVFLILVVIQFAVVTNGAGRVSEVAARFALDAMPGKQIAVDAQLSSGSITGEGGRGTS